MSSITRKRGDTYAETVTVTALSGAAIDITAYTFKLTVDPENAPATAVNNLFSIVGTVLNGPAGLVEFALTALQADHLPGTYYYDIQLIDGAGRIRTIALDRWIIQQDISK